MASNVIEILLRVKDGASQALGKFNKSLDLTGAKIAGFGVGAVTIGAVFAKIVGEMKDASEANARLAAAFKANAGAAGLSQRTLEDYATQLQRTSTFSDESVKRGEALLLQFRNIRGEVFRLANQAMVDLAAKMGGDVAGAAQLLGRALQEPQRGLDGLRRAGIVLSDAQRALVKNFVELGDISSAQRVILEQVERQAGGTAEALRHTLGGSVMALKNAFNDLFEGTPQEVNQVTEAILKVADALEDPEFKSAVQFQVGLIAKLTAGWLEAGVAAEKYADRARRAAINAKDSLLEATNKQLNRIKINGTGLGDATLGNFLPDVGDLRQSPSIRGDPKAVKAAQDALVQLEEIRIGVDAQTHTIVQRLSEFRNDWERTLAGWNDDTRTATEKQLDDFSEFTSKLGEVFNAGLIDAETYNKRLAEAFKNATPVPHFKTEDLDEELDKLNVFAEQAARNMQDILANALSGKGRGNVAAQILDTFKSMFAQMEAQAILSAFHIQERMQKLADSIKSTFGSGGGFGGILSGIVAGIGSLFFAGGGTSPGGVATVGEGGPEKVFLPRGSKVISSARTRREAAGNNRGSSRPVTVKVEQNFSGLGLTAPQVQAMVTKANQILAETLARTFRDNGIALR